MQPRSWGQGNICYCKLALRREEFHRFVLRCGPHTVQYTYFNRGFWSVPKFAAPVLGFSDFWVAFRHTSTTELLTIWWTNILHIAFLSHSIVLDPSWWQNVRPSHEGKTNLNVFTTIPFSWLFALNINRWGFEVRPVPCYTHTHSAKFPLCCQQQIGNADTTFPGLFHDADALLLSYSF